MPGRFVFDTNVILSAALLPTSKPRKAFDKARQNGVLLVSEEVIEELNDVFRRNEFEKYTTEALRVEFLAALLRDAELVQITETVTVSRDPRDDKFLSLAVSGNADCVVSGDKDLLTLESIQNIPIRTPSQFLDLNEAQG